jgi:peptidoglycan/LPS O-acetylase OafA/YrhL
MGLGPGEKNELTKKIMGVVQQWWEWLEKQIFEDTSTGGVKFSALDGLRGVAVLMVFLSHSSGFNQRLLPWLNFRYFGHLGVYLFFVLSGFMLAYGLLGRRGISLGGFYGRRFLRIAPLYYLVVTGVFAIQLISGQPGFCHLLVSGGWWGYFRHLVFMQGDSVFWTIAVEFQFYIILPGLIWLLQRYGARAFWGLAVFGVAYGG